MPISKVHLSLPSEVKVVGEKLIKNNIPGTDDWSQKDWERWILRNKRNIESHNYGPSDNQALLLNQIA